MIRFGIAGWQYRDWEGIVYPKPQPRGFDPLSYLAGFFDVAEIDSSFYRPPQPGAARGWVRRVADHRDFRFTGKLLKGFTHERNETAKDEKLFKDGIQPLLDAGGLGALFASGSVVVQERAEKPRTTCAGSVAGLPNTRSSVRCATAAGSNRKSSTPWPKSALGCAILISRSFTVQLSRQRSQHLALDTCGCTGAITKSGSPQKQMFANATTSYIGSSNWNLGSIASERFPRRCATRTS